MGLDPNVVDQLVALVRERFPDWTGFDDEDFRVDERNYKVKAVESAIGPDGLLLETALRGDLDGRALTSFIECFDKIGHATNLLYQSVPMSGDLSALYHARDGAPDVFEGYCRSLLDLIWGAGPSPERLGRYLDFVTANDLPNKWTLPTYFLYLTHPEEDLFIKPRTMGRIAKRFGTDWSVKGAPTADEYSNVLRWSHDLRAALQPLGAADMIDVQSLLWVAGSRLSHSTQLSAEPHATQRYWKIAPGEGARLWTSWREHDYISVGWAELGDLSQVTAAEWPEHRDTICAQHGWKTAGTDQSWHFAKDIMVGDRIVANRGTTEALGFGTVVGGYYFMPGEEHAHRIPVKWDDVVTRSLAQPNHGWQRTLLEMTQEDFVSLVALPEAPGGTGLGAPFGRIFANRAEAEWAFELLAEACGLLGVASASDPRMATTLPNGQSHLHLDLGNWLMVGFEPPGNENDLGMALLAAAPGIDKLEGGIFKMPGGGDSIFALKYLPRAKYHDDGDLQDAFRQSMPALGSHFAQAKGIGVRKFHVPEVADAVFDTDVRAELLTLGLKEYRRRHGGLAKDAAFSTEARNLLVAMAAEPTKSFYAAHKEELTQHVQEPVQQLLRQVANRIAPPLQEALETSKKLFGIFPKNDWGKGGAWPYYWGAFYPIGGKKPEGCQLYVFLDEEGFSYGFSIGNYASDDRKRFARSSEENRLALVATLGETVNAPEFEFGKENESAGGQIAEGPESLDLTGWLESGAKVEPHAHVLLPWHELLATEREQLIADVADAFNRLFPLVLLSMIDEPMPAIRAYMEGDVAGEEEDEVNPPYSLDDLVAETSLPKENLESWLRAIERKGQAILYGPPGTGKTYVAERLAKHLVAGGTGACELVQFHPAYAYEDFMQGIRPKAREGGGLDYPVVDGRFKQFCQEARGRSGVSVLVIDEVNRANLARVFGELMYLLEYRDKSIPLASGGSFSIPNNVRIIGTMNTADRSIALVDHALRRRFAFLPLYPDYKMLTDFHAKAAKNYDPAKLIEVLKDLNRKIGDHHYEVGTSFFLRPDIEEQLPDVWRMEIEPYLEEYFFDQQGTVDSFRWDEVKKRLGTE